VPFDPAAWMTEWRAWLKKPVVPMEPWALLVRPIASDAFTAPCWRRVDVTPGGHTHGCHCS
jgi:hypothetical protein